MTLRLVCWILLVGPLSAQTPPETKEEKPKLRFTIGKETTLVEGPLDKNGRIDYAAALNERLGKGIKPENNANVLLWQAMGPRPEGGDRGMGPEYFKLLGMEEPTPAGNYFLSIERYLKDLGRLPMGEAMEEFQQKQSRFMQRPWKAADSPDTAEWLKAIDKSLAVAIEATKRPDYFNPLVPTKSPKGESSGLIGALLPNVQKNRAIATALITRAMLNLGEGKADAAWQDLMAVHRLGRLVARGGTLIEMLVGIALEMTATQADLVYLDTAKPDAKTLEACVKDLSVLPPFPTVASKIDLTERFMFLDIVMMVDAHGMKYLNGLGGGDGKAGFAENLVGGFIQANIDWDPALENAKKWYDRLVAALGEKNRPERVKQLIQIEEELRKLKGQATDPGNITQAILKGKGAGKEVGRSVGNILICLLVPAIQKVQEAADRTAQVNANLHLAFALARHKADAGRYPENLADLAPKYLKEVAADVFSGKALIYKSDGKSYTLYSVGPNGIDEAGRSRDDDPRGDDLKVQQPLPELKKPN